MDHLDVFAAAGADYTSCGPLWATPTKPDTKPVGLGLIEQYKASIHIPFFAIGSITPANLGRVLSAGAERVAAVRALWNAPDPKIAVKEFKEQIAQSRKEVPV